MELITISWLYILYIKINFIELTFTHALTINNILVMIIWRWSIKHKDHTNTVTFYVPSKTDDI